MSSKIGKIWLKHSKKTEVSASKRRAFDSDYERLSVMIKDVLYELKVSAVDVRLIVSDSNDLSLEEIGKLYPGQRDIQLSIPKRDAGRGEITQDDKATTFNRVMESGASLAFHYTRQSALLQVFIWPPRDDDAIEEREPFISFVTHDPAKVTRKMVEKQVSLFFAVYRVYSSLEDSSVWDRLKVRLWMFADPRNREYVTSDTKYFFTPWEIAIFAAGFAVLNSLIALGSMIFGYLALKP